MNKEKKILVTGLSGQVGSSIHNNFKDKFNICALERDKFDFSKLNEIKNKIRSINPDMVINPAAYTNVELAEDNHEEAYLINTLAPSKIAEVCAELSIPLIHFSTDYVFDGKNISPYTENDEPNPINFYGYSKLKGENLVIKNTNQYFIIRTSWVYNFYKGKNFLRTMLKLFKENNEIKVINDQVGCPTSSNFISIKLLSLVEKFFENKLKDDFGIYNLTTDGKASWYNFANEIHKLSGLNDKLIITPVSSDEFQTRAKRPKMSILNNDKICSLLGEKNKTWLECLEKEFRIYSR